MTTPPAITEILDPHADQLLLTAGPTPEESRATIIVLHGRGATAESILSVYRQLNMKEVAAVAPQAHRQTWYPQTFLAPLAANQPWLDSALRRVNTLVLALLERGVGSDRIALLGFSQGACLALEYAARHPRRYGAVIGFTGGLIGAPGTPRDYPGSLDGMPVFLGAGDPDPHVPFTRVQETAAVFEQMGAVVNIRRYPGMAHTINEDELESCRALLRGIIASPMEKTP